MTKVSIPSPPAFPATFASYSNTADKMHKAALNSVSAEAAVLAVGAILASVGGINTYARRVRKYGEELTAALQFRAAAEAEFKSYSSVSNAKRAVKAAGFDPALFQFVPVGKGKVVPQAGVPALADA
jgi:hypothetical protein